MVVLTTDDDQTALLDALLKAGLTVGVGGVTVQSSDHDDLSALAQNLTGVLGGIITQQVLVGGDVQNVDVGRGVLAVSIDVDDAGFLSLLNDGIQTGSRNGVHQNDVVTLVNGVLDLLGLGSSIPVGDEGSVGNIQTVIGGGSSSLLNVSLVTDAVGVALNNSIMRSELKFGLNLCTIIGACLIVNGSLLAASNQSQSHDQSQDQCQELFHVISS